MHLGSTPTSHRQTWPFFNTPLRVYLGVMLPICGLMTFLMVVPQQAWVRGSAAVVVGCSIYGLLRGYVRRLTMDVAGVQFTTLGGSFEMTWAQVQRIDVYIPSGAVNGVRHLYVTANDRPPQGKWEIDSRTFQVQDRPGLLHALQASWRDAISNDSED